MYMLILCHTRVTRVTRQLVAAGVPRAMPSRVDRCVSTLLSVFPPTHLQAPSMLLSHYNGRSYTAFADGAIDDVTNLVDTPRLPLGPRHEHLILGRHVIAKSLSRILARCRPYCCWYWWVCGPGLDGL